VPYGTHLEALKDDREGQHSIRVNEIVLEKRGITPDTALQLARYFGTSAEMWTGLQADYDLRLVRHQKARTIEREVEPLAAVQPVMA
jgi:plasmid maintenance system antidote protein VapI